MNFFFDYIYYRVTKRLFKRDGRTGATAIALISLMQLFIMMLFLQPIYSYFVSQDIRAEYAKPFGQIMGGIGLIFMYFNYKKYNGSYNKFRYYWRDEAKTARLMKGILVIISLFLPMIIYFISGMK